jgi:hypothetical protein
MPENTVASRTKSTASVITTMTSAWPNIRNTFFIQKLAFDVILPSTQILPAPAPARASSTRRANAPP